jgi:uncharacterized alkaline shock family protein YloU
MPEEPTRAVPGRAVVARRALSEIIRDAALGSYGVTGLAEPTLLARVRARLGLGSRAIHVAIHPTVTADVWLTIAYGVPVAEVARQVDSAVRYGLERALGREVGAVAIHVQGLGGRPFASGAPAAAVPSMAGALRADPPQVPAPPPDDGAPTPEVARTGPAAGAA